MSKILIIGGTGLIGSHITPQLVKNHSVAILSRKKRANENGIKYYHWDPENNFIEEEALVCDIIINLAGEGIADKRWSPSRKKILIDSRVVPLQFLAGKISSLGVKPKLFIGASAIGYYGHRGEETLIESSSLGEGFLAHCSKVWEVASSSVSSLCERAVLLRIGVVLSSKGGALPELLMTSRFGFLSYFGQMYYSWIHIHDVYNIIKAVINDDRYSGIVNAVSPNPLRNKTMIQNIAALHKKLILPAPSFFLKIFLGEMSDVVLNSTKVVPENLINKGFIFQFNDVGEATKNLLENKI